MKELDKNYCEETIRLNNQIQVAFLDLGKRLMKIRDERLFETYGDFEDFLMEMKMSGATASKLINIYAKFVLMANIPPERLALVGGWSILAEGLRIVTTPDEAERFIEMAINSTQTDIRRNVKEEESGIDMRKCKHEWVTLRYCKCCGLKERVYGEEK